MGWLHSRFGDPDMLPPAPTYMRGAGYLDVNLASMARRCKPSHREVAYTIEYYWWDVLRKKHGLEV